MKCDIPIPFKKLIWFQERLGLEGGELDKLDRYRGVFASRKKEFSEHLADYFVQIPETRKFLEHEKRPGHLKKIWEHWFGSLFLEKDNQRFLTNLWRSGLRHVEINVDQRFISLGYSIARQFCQNVAEAEIPVSDRETVLVCVDKMIDLCLLIETHAFISGTSQCDMEVVKGISHQVRNPLTIIGGNIARLMRDVDPKSTVHKVYDAILEENRRLEKMVSDVSIYSEMFEKDAVFSEIILKDLINKALKNLEETLGVEHIHIDIDLDPEASEVTGDPEDMSRMFYYLLENSLEAVDPGNPSIRISSKRKGGTASYAEIEIFNTGKSINPEEIDNLFVPFYSSKPYGTGFGLPIAQLAAKKCLGDLYLEPVDHEGTRCVIELPVPI
jgi:signal transduction histidine kinase